MSEHAPSDPRPVPMGGGMTWWSVSCLAEDCPVVSTGPARTKVVRQVGQHAAQANEAERLVAAERTAATPGPMRPPGVPKGARRVTLAELADWVAKENGSLALGPRGSYLRLKMPMFPFGLYGTVRRIDHGVAEAGHRVFSLSYSFGARRAGYWQTVLFREPGAAERELWIWTLADPERERRAQDAARNRHRRALATLRRARTVREARRGGGDGLMAVDRAFTVELHPDDPGPTRPSWEEQEWCDGGTCEHETCLDEMTYRALMEDEG